jgi:hypothetical protein
LFVGLQVMETGGHADKLRAMAREAAKHTHARQVSSE